MEALDIFHWNSDPRNSIEVVYRAEDLIGLDLIQYEVERATDLETTWGDENTLQAGQLICEVFEKSEFIVYPAIEGGKIFAQHYERDKAVINVIIAHASATDLLEIG